MAQNKNIRYLKGVGEKRAKLYEKLGITDTYGLLRHFPRSYLDFTNPFSIALAPINEACVVKGRVFAKNPEQRIRKGMTLYKVFVTDDATDLTITFFNNRFAPAALEIDGEYLFYGKLTGGITRREMTSPVFFPADAEVGLSPIYPLTEGLSSKIIANNVKQALSELDDLTPDTLPPALRKQLELCHISFALKNIHLPQSQADLDTAKRRLIFEELLILQLALFTLKSRDRAVNSHVIKNTDLSDFYKNLPFTPTNAQTRAVNEALNDMAGAKPMNRLVQGDVGSGKTMVAAALCYACAKSGVQSALMAPTEILASQHYSSLSPMLEACGIKCALLTGSCGAKKRKEIIAGLCDGSISFIVGTHALISDDVEFNNLGLVVTDEQHRFGVNQRSALGGKGKNPHTLVMSATPIPRTLALIFYGDLDISVLDELPPGRQPIKTYLIDSPKRERALGFIKRHLAEGRQAYIVCPLVEESEESDLTSVTAYAREIKAAFAGYTVGVMHGKLKPNAKEKIMTDFKNGSINLLVSTTVIEVGVDVPNAVIMMVENAERFGLSQLHQLRGRVGRGRFESHCILVSDSRNEATVERLKTMCRTTDGFKLAEQDLRLRGPGDFFGSRQHGLPTLKIADMLTDMAVLTKAQETARKITEQNALTDCKEYAELKQAVDKMLGVMDGNGFN